MVISDAAWERRGQQASVAVATAASAAGGRAGTGCGTARPAGGDRTARRADREPDALHSLALDVAGPAVVREAVERMSGEGDLHRVVRPLGGAEHRRREAAARLRRTGGGVGRPDARTLPGAGRLAGAVRRVEVQGPAGAVDQDGAQRRAGRPYGGRPARGRARGRGGRGGGGRGRGSRGRGGAGAAAPGGERGGGSRTSGGEEEAFHGFPLLGGRLPRGDG